MVRPDRSGVCNKFQSFRQSRSGLFSWPAVLDRQRHIALWRPQDPEHVRVVHAETDLKISGACVGNVSDNYGTRNIAEIHRDQDGPQNFPDRTKLPSVSC